MNFKHLTEAECGQPSALAQLSTHVTHDRAFSDTHGQLFPNTPADQLVEQFLQETRSLPQTFRMDGLMREMQEIESQKLVLPPVPASAIKEQIQHDSAWAQQYIEDGKVFNANFDHNKIWEEISSREQNIIGHHLNKQYIQNVDLEASMAQQSGHELINNVQDPKFVYSKFMNFMRNVEEGEMKLDDGKLTEREAEIWSDEFLKNAAGAVSADTWANELVNSEDDYNSNIWNGIQEQIKNVERTDEESEESNWVADYQDELYEHYTYSEENPMSDINDPLEKGKQYLAAGDLPTAVLCFEAAVLRTPQKSEAWFYLGRTQAENEQDPNAIAALKKCINLDPTNLPALMALSVSYTNENLYNQACETLFVWLKTNAKYADLVLPNMILTGQVSSLLHPEKLKSVQDLFIRAAQRQPVDIDYEVQCALGVLFNLSGDYDKAVDCFNAALAVKPQDSRLWNRLGATLANGSRPEEAVQAYHRSLTIAPGFIRARYNVGITCIHMSAYKEAAEHFLVALNQQARGRDVTNSGFSAQMSETIWSTLKMCVSLMDRSDLKAAVQSRDLAFLNKVLDVTDEPQA
ncbi:hypothetical protein WA026_017282 [Henosepilachna vigintioctopunctata]|uniref:Peroxisomal targeting signal 1 receptor n=1 Tax=Henosepilachna vigintioctopunctata TaxID=420089 RepID=A0AAW1UMN2_9CUCU